MHICMYVSMRVRMYCVHVCVCVCVCIDIEIPLLRRRTRMRASAYVSIRQDTSAYVIEIPLLRRTRMRAACGRSSQDVASTALLLSHCLYVCTSKASTRMTWPALPSS